MFNSYEELKAHVEQQRENTLTLELDLGGTYSPEYEEAKSNLAKAEALQLVAGGQGGFLSNNLAALKAKVEELRPEPKLVWLRFRKLPLEQWAALLKQTGVSPVEQFESVLPDTFVGLFNQDPDVVEDIEPLVADPDVLRVGSSMSVLPGSSLQGVIQAFMSWQNSGGEVNIHPTKSGRG